MLNTIFITGGASIKGETCARLAIGEFENVLFFDIQGEKGRALATATGATNFQQDDLDE